MTNPLIPSAPTVSNPLPSPNQYAPACALEIDPTSGQMFAAGICNYTSISTLGTTTLKGGNPGLYFGFCALSTGTAAMSVNAFDIVVSGTTTTTNTLAAPSTPAALGFGGAPCPAGMGVRSQGFIAVVTGGTAGVYNALWD